MICENVSLVYLDLSELAKDVVPFGTGSFRYRDRHHWQSQTERPSLSISVCFC